MNILCGTPISFMMSRKGIELLTKSPCGGHYYQSVKWQVCLLKQNQSNNWKGRKLSLACFRKGRIMPSLIRMTKARQCPWTMMQHAWSWSPQYTQYKQSLFWNSLWSGRNKLQELDKGGWSATCISQYLMVNGPRSPTIGIITSSSAMCQILLHSSSMEILAHACWSNQPGVEKKCNWGRLHSAGNLLVWRMGWVHVCWQFPWASQSRLPYTWAVGTGADFGLNQWVTYSDIKPWSQMVFLIRGHCWTK